MTLPAVRKTPFTCIVTSYISYKSFYILVRGTRGMFIAAEAIGETSRDG
jgi:hypothetical protein